MGPSTNWRILRMVELLVVISMICVGGGLSLFAASLYYIQQINQLIARAKIKKSWEFVRVLVLFFCFGYVVSLFAILLNATDLLTLMATFVYLFGALFVLIVMRLSHRTYALIISSAEEADT